MSTKRDRNMGSENPKKNPLARRQRPRIGYDGNGSPRREDGAYLAFKPAKPVRSKYTPK